VLENHDWLQRFNQTGSSLFTGPAERRVGVLIEGHLPIAARMQFKKWLCSEVSVCTIETTIQALIMINLLPHRKCAWAGACPVIRQKIAMGRNEVAGVLSLVTRGVHAFSDVVGNPARGPEILKETG